MSCTDLLHCTATELAAAVHAGDVSPVALVDAHIRRIEQVNPALNALAAERFAAARVEAEHAEREARAGTAARPLLGVPFTVKELIELDGMPLTFGSMQRRDRRALADATVVARLRAAGAIPLGVTNVPEWGMWSETYNHVYGRTSNPYDLRCTPGGSSGGEGAIVGAGGAVFGIGSDIGGSVRMPAAFCGLYGHKPTHGLLPITGHFPVYASGPDAHLSKRAPHLSLGTLTRSARDIALLLRIMAGPDGVDPQAESLQLPDPDAVTWRGRRVLLLAAPQIDSARAVSSETRAAVERAGAVLEALGADVHEAPHDLLAHAARIWFAALQSVEGPSFAELIGGGDAIRLHREIARAALRRGEYSWTALLFAIGERLGRRSEKRVRAALADLDRLHARIAELLGADGVLLTPTHPRTAPRHHAPILRPFDFLYTAVFNALRQPATSVPMSFGAGGLPLAVQISSARGNDHLTIAAALVLEEENAAWRPACVPGVDDVALEVAPPDRQPRAER